MKPVLNCNLILLPACAMALAACGQGIKDERSPADKARAPDPAVAAATQPATPPPRAVMVGFDGPRFDACAGFGVVTNLNPRGDNYLSVRSAPAGTAEEIDRLGPDKNVAMCQQVGDWLGVVYAPEGEADMDCGTGAPVAEKSEYSGPCKSGWVNENYIKLIAG